MVQINKYFRNIHLPAAWYKAAGGTNLTLPIDVRWNSVTDCLESYLKNWFILLKVCEEHCDTIDKGVAETISNIAIKRNAEDYLACMKPISVAVDQAQAENVASVMLLKSGRNSKQTSPRNPKVSGLSKKLVRVRLLHKLTC